MPRQTTQQRRDKLLAYIEANTPTRLQILNTLYSLNTAGQRMFQRDLKDLREEYSIASDDNEHLFLEGRPDASILSAILSPTEQQLLLAIQSDFDTAHPYSADVQALVQKLTGHIQTQHQHIAYSAPTRYFGAHFARDYTEHKPTLLLLEEARRQMRCVRFTYFEPVSRDIAEVPHREVEPQSIEVHNGSLYLYGYEPHRARFHDFRLDKMRDFTLLPGKFGAFRKPDDTEFEYLLHPSVAKGGISERFADQTQIGTTHDGWLRMRARGRRFWVCQEMLRLGRKARLLSPEAWCSQIAAEIAVMNEFYNPPHE